MAERGTSPLNDKLIKKQKQKESKLELVISESKGMGDKNYRDIKVAIRVRKIIKRLYFTLHDS